MIEIDNKINSLNFKGIQKPAAEDPQLQESLQAQSETKEIKDLGNMPAAALGKSQVASDSLESDMKFFEKNPQLAKELNDAIDKYAETHTEEETLKLLEKTHQEFVSKK